MTLAVASAGRRSACRTAFAAIVWIIVATGFMAVAAQRESDDSPASLARAIDRLRSNAEYAEAIPLAEKRIALLEADPAAEAWQLGDARRLLATLRKVADAAEADRAAFAEQRERRGDFSRAYSTRDFRGAIALLDQQLAIDQRIIGDSAESARVMMFLGVCYRGLGALDDARVWMERALAMYTRTVEPIHPLRVLALGNLGQILSELDDIIAAERVLRETWRAQRDLRGERHPQTLSALNNLVVLLFESDRLGEAEPLAIQALEICRESLGDEDADRLTAESRLSAIWRQQGRLEDAELLMRRVYAIRRRTLGNGHPSTLSAANELGNLLFERGRHAESEALLQEVLTQRRAHAEPGDPLLPQALRNLAAVYVGEQRYTEALPLVEEAVALGPRLSPSPLDTLITQIQLASVRGRLDMPTPADIEAVDALFRSIERRSTEIEGVPTRLVLRIENDHAAFLRRQRRLEEAHSRFEGVLTATRQHYGAQHAETVAALSNLASLDVQLERYGDAVKLYAEALESAELLRPHLQGDQRDRASFAGALKLRGMATASGFAYASIGAAEDAFDVLERGRSRALFDVLRASSAQLDLDAETRRELERRRQAAHDAGRRVWEGEMNLRAALEAHRRAATTQIAEKIDEAAQRVESERAELTTRRFAGRRAAIALEALLAQHSRLGQPIRVDGLRALLEPNEVLVSYGSCQLGIFAVTITKTEANVHRICSGADDVDSVAAKVDAFRHWLTERGAGDGRAPARDLAEAILPFDLRQRWARADRVIIVADGTLADLPFEALVALGASEVEATRVPHFCYATSATIFGHLRSRPHRPGIAGAFTATIVANPRFAGGVNDIAQAPEHGVLIAAIAPDSNAALGGLREGDVLLELAGHRLTDRQSLADAVAKLNGDDDDEGRRNKDEWTVAYWRQGEVRHASLHAGKLGLRPSSDAPRVGMQLASLLRGDELPSRRANRRLDRFGGSLASLPGTAREAAGIAALIERLGGRAVRLEQGDATLARLESEPLAESRFVHIASHGLLGSSQHPYDAAIALTPPARLGIDDFGFLTLERIIDRWRGKLQSCELVTLSGCDSRCGVQTGDSVMSLPWGFFAAGAPTVLASLWPVDDDSTAVLMQEFYRNWLERGQTKAAALAAAQRSLREMGIDEVLKRLGMTREQFDARYERRGVGKTATALKGKAIVGPPYAHPFYWSAFVLVGRPE